MILYSSPASPFGRKVRIAIGHLDLSDQVEIRKADLNEPSDPVFTANPVGKIPVLVTDEGDAVYDSRVILDYLDGRAGGGVIQPADPAARTRALTLQATADGILDAGILQVYEKRYRPEGKRHQPWVDRQSAKIDRSLAALEASPPDRDSAIDVGDIALACALGYLDFRFDRTWRATNPGLVAWLDEFAASVPAFGETAPTD